MKTSYILQQREGKMELAAFMMAVALAKGDGPFEILSRSEDDAKHFMRRVEHHLMAVVGWGGEDPLKGPCV